MKSILTLGLIFASLTTYSQGQHLATHKDLGFGFTSFRESSLRDTGRIFSPRSLLDVKDSTHTAMVGEFARQFPGQESFVLTASLLDTLANSRNNAAGVHLFLGSEKGKLQVIMTHTRIDTAKVNNTFSQRDNAIKHDSAANYNVLYDRAYYWNNRKRNWQSVKDTGKLQQDILTSRKQAQEKYGYRIQGYYLSKDLLLKIRKEAGQESLTVFLGHEGNVFHLILPILTKTPSIEPVIHYATDYKKTLFGFNKISLPPYKTNHYANRDANYSASLSQAIISIPLSMANPVSLTPPPPKDHNTVRTCQPYCNN